MTELMADYYEVLGNRDQTEGKGGMTPKAAYAIEADAVTWADSSDGRRACGVMGHGPGEVVHVEILVSEQGRITVKRTKIWGYREDWNGRWNYGYVDLRDKPEDDPEWAEYVRLKAKFGG